MSTERDMMTTLQTNLQAINGVGLFTFDVSGADQVIIGIPKDPDRVPAVYIAALSTQTQQTPGRTLLINYDRRMTVQVLAFCAALNADPGELHLRALDLQDDVMRALEADRCLGGLCRDLEISGTTYNGEELNLPGLGLAVLSVDVIYSEKAGI